MRLPAVCLERPASRTKNVQPGASSSPGTAGGKVNVKGKGKGKVKGKGKGQGQGKAFGGKLRRPALERARAEGSPEVRGLADLTVGEILVGRVRVSVRYGLIVNLKGVAVDGLLHQSEYPSDDRWLGTRCKRGTVVHAAVKGVDPAAGQLALTLRQKGCYVEKKRIKVSELAEGDLYEGRIKKIADSGVFVDFGAQVQGFRASDEDVGTVFLRQRVVLRLGACDPEQIKVRRMVPVHILAQAELDALVTSNKDSSAVGKGKESKDAGGGDKDDDDDFGANSDLGSTDDDCGDFIADSGSESEDEDEDDIDDDGEREEWQEEDDFYNRYAELDDL